MSTTSTGQNRRLFVEFVLVVVGVLFALMIEGILDDRQDESERDAYVERLKADIEADKRSIEHRIELFIDVKSFSADVLEWLNSDAAVDKKLLLASFYSAEVFPHVTILGTYQDLHNTGNKVASHTG